LQKDIFKNPCSSKYSDTTQAKIETLQQIYAKFSSTCKRYTDVMAIKTHLQCQVFTSEHSIIPQITQLIIKLQTAAIKLQKMEVSDII